MINILQQIRLQQILDNLVLTVLASYMQRVVALAVRNVVYLEVLQDHHAARVLFVVEAFCGHF